MSYCLIYRSGGTMAENKTMIVHHFPDCNSSEDYLPEQGTAKNYRTYSDLSNAKKLSECCSGDGPACICGAIMAGLAFFVDFTLTKEGFCCNDKK